MQLLLSNVRRDTRDKGSIQNPRTISQIEEENLQMPEVSALASIRRAGSYLLLYSRNPATPDLALLRTFPMRMEGCVACRWVGTGTKEQT
ncbi:hypothetical protein WG66_014766 [Moniliophthora roreri]|nr:hypothetical protein WG66_014766 [Moniliophthora roreri]